MKYIRTIRLYIEKDKNNLISGLLWFFAGIVITPAFFGICGLLSKLTISVLVALVLIELVLILVLSVSLLLLRDKNDIATFYFKKNGITLEQIEADFEFSQGFEDGI